MIDQEMFTAAIAEIRKMDSAQPKVDVERNCRSVQRTVMSQCDRWLSGECQCTDRDALTQCEVDKLLKGAL